MAKLFREAAIAALILGAGWTVPSDAGSLVMPPPVPKATAAGELVGFILQNPTASAIPKRIITFGQVFASGTLKPGQHLVAKGINQNEAVQMDVLAANADGSVRFAAITLQQPALESGQSLPGILAISAGNSGASVDLARIVPALVATIAPLGATSGETTEATPAKIDLGAALRAALASASPNYWLKGPLATEARVDVKGIGALHVTADITGYADGTIAADVQFNNDLAMTDSGGTLAYDATVLLNGVTKSIPSITQYQYQDWHVKLGSLSEVNIQHDPAYLEHAGAVLSYDLTTGVAEATLQTYTKEEQSPGFGAPLSTNAVTQYMPTTGGRPDIGYTTQYNTVWLITQDARAATIARAQGDAGGAVPWNMKLANGEWLTPRSYNKIWTDGRGGPGSYTTGLTQPTSYPTAGWTPETAHQPDLAFVPYLMTASRWYLDRLNAQAAFDLTYDWPTARCLTPACVSVLNGADQPRAQAWSLRELLEAAWIGAPGSIEQTYFTNVVGVNREWLASREASLFAAQGEAHGWLTGAYGNAGATAPWEQDYFAGVAVLGAEMGYGNIFVGYVRNWSEGRFTAADMNWHDGCNYNLMVSNPSTNLPYTTWSDIEQATVKAGLSNGTGWLQSQGDYCSLARAALGGLLTIDPSDSRAAHALSWLEASGAPFIGASTFQADPTFNVVPLK